jgi:hypothetical protein
MVTFNQLFLFLSAGQLSCYKSAVQMLPAFLSSISIAKTVISWL